MIKVNCQRLAEINKPYNQLTGEGSLLKREKVVIKGFPTEVMYLTPDFVSTPFVTKLIELGVQGYINTILGTGCTDALKEELWIEFLKERIPYDFELYAILGVIIDDKISGADIHFKLNRPQRYYLSKLEELRLKNAPIDIILLKARQWGGSTLTQLYMMWIQTFHKQNWNSVICGHVESAARIVSGMLQKAVDNMPLWITSSQIKTSPYMGSVKTRTINITGSRFSVGSAEKPESLRSENISMAHLTEVGLWRETKGKKPEDLIQAIFGSIFSSPYSMKVLESTAKGIGNYFHRTWQAAVAGTNNFTPVFIPWFMIDMYSEYIDHKTYYKFILDMNEYEHELFRLGATLEAIKWYRSKSKEMNDRWRMCSEYPSTPSEAFQSTGNRVFPIKYVEQIRKFCCEPCFYGEFVGEAEKGEKAFKGLHFEEGMTPDKDNILWVWCMPDTSLNYRDRYVVSVDIGGASRTADPSSIGVIDRLPMLEEGGVPEVIAEWHGHIEHDLLIWKAAQVAKAYGDALLVIESNTLETEGTEGDNFEYILDEIVEYYDNLYSRTTPEQIKQNIPTKYGFHTNPKTKPMIINFLKASMRDYQYIERCMPTTYEMDTYEIKDNGKEMGAVEGCHDDRVMQRSIGVYVSWKWPLPYEIIISTKVKANRIVSEASM